LELLPKLTSVLLEIFSEEPFQRKTKLNFEMNQIEYKPQELISSIVRFIAEVYPRTEPSRKVTLKAGIDGTKQGEWVDVKRGDLLTITANISEAPGVSLHDDEI